MVIIVDTNIIISACLESKSELYKILTTTYIKLDFTVPDLVLEEIVRHQTEICKKTKKSIVLFQHNLSILLSNLLILPSTDLSINNIHDAEKFTADVDIDDTIFVAFAMALNSPLWTGDLKLYKALHRKGFTNIILTKEMKQILQGL